jgi:hypothetical protein
MLDVENGGDAVFDTETTEGATEGKRLATSYGMPAQPQSCSVVATAVVLTRPPGCPWDREVIAETAYTYTELETDDVRFAFEACVPEKSEKEYGGKVIEVSLLFDLLRALTTSDDSDDITLADVQRLVSKAKAAVVKQQREAKDAARRSKTKLLAKVVPFKGMLKTDSNAKSAADQVNFTEFFLMMTDEETAHFLPGGNFITAAFKIRILKYAFELIDSNGDGTLSYEEFTQAADALTTTKVSDQFATELWGIVAPVQAKDGEGVITFVEFATGMATVQSDPVYSKKFDLFETNVLMSMIVDLPVSKVEEQHLLAGMSGLERAGMSVAKRSDHHEWSAEKRNAVMQTVQKRQIHVLTDSQRAAMNTVHKRNVYQGAVAGFLSGLVCAIFENLLTWWLQTDGVANPFHCVPEEVCLCLCVSVSLCLCVSVSLCLCVSETPSGALSLRLQSYQSAETSRSSCVVALARNPARRFEWTQRIPGAGLQTGISTLCGRTATGGGFCP